MSDLLALAADATALVNSITDPAAGPASTVAAVAAVRTLPQRIGNPGPPGPNLDLLDPNIGVPPPLDSGSLQAGDSIGPGDVAVSPPLPVAGPIGPVGPAGATGPPGPPGPGVDPARVAALEAAMLLLQTEFLEGFILGSH